MKKIITAAMLFLVLFTSCSEDTSSPEDQTIRTNGKSVSFEKFKSLTGLQDFKKVIQIKRQHATSRVMQMEDFTINTDLIKQTVVNQNVSYTFNIVPKIITDKKFYNLIVYHTEGGWKYSIIEFDPNAQTAQAYEDGQEIPFEGKMKEIYTTAARTITICTTVFVQSYHCTGTGECASGTCDLCNLCVSYDVYKTCGQSEDLEEVPEAIVDLPYHGPGGGGGGTPVIEVPAGGYVFDLNLLNTRNTIKSSNFWQTLSLEQKNWANANQLEYAQLINYLVLHYTPENFNGALQMITSMINNDGYSGDGFLGDADDDNTDYTGPKQFIPQSITSQDGTVVTITFGTTQSDNQNANQQVAVDLVNAIQSALNDANNNLPNGEKITSIAIKATTNGTHHPDSNHYRGTAIDINKINGNKILTLGPNNQVSALQNGFESYDNIRENFGPVIKHKTLPDGTVLNSQIGGHRDHIHISVQSNP